MENNQDQVPLYTALRKYRRKGAVSFHTPGHKGGRAFPDEVRSDWFGLTSFDFTELPETDDLYAPYGPLILSQQLLAELYGAGRSFYLTNGASIGVTAALIALTQGAPKRLRKVLITDQAHRSVWHGLILADLWPIVLRSEVDQHSGLPLPLGTEELQRALEIESDIAAVVLLHPSYHGLCGRLKQQVELVHRYDIPVIVDEAHGTHLRFLSEPIADAMQCGADIAIQSPHKTATSLTQTAWMHVQGSRISATIIQDALRLLQSSSPSFPFLISLELTRHQLAKYGKIYWSYVEYLRSRMRRFQLIEQFPSQVSAVDPSKMFFNTADIGISGYDAADMLRKAKVAPEMATSRGVLCILTIADRIATVFKLEGAFECVYKSARVPIICTSHAFTPPHLKRLLSPKEAWSAERREVELVNAAGEVAAEMITPYPPGIPLVTPGDEINHALIDYIGRLCADGAHLTGIDESGRIKVVV